MAEQIPGEILKQTVYDLFKIYLENHSKDQPPSDLYKLLIAHVEPALFQVVLDHTHGNISKAAAILGITRTTLAKKIQNS